MLNRTIQLLSGVFFLFLSFQLSAQDNLWPITDGEWWVERILPASIVVDDSAGVGTVANGFTTTQIYYHMDEESEVFGETYQLLYQTYESSFLSMDGEYTFEFPPVTEPQLRGGFRLEDNQVYFWDVITNQPYLLFDFDLEVGDEIPYSYVSNVGGRQITEIETILIDNVPAKVFHIEGPGMTGNTIVEGVGSLYGPIQNLGIGFDSSYQLICHSRNGLPMYPFSDACADPEVMSTFTQGFNSFSFQLYPNPSSGMLQLRLSENKALESVSLLNLLGEEVTKLTQSSQGMFQIPLGVSSGIYFLKVELQTGEFGVERLIYNP